MRPLTTRLAGLLLATLAVLTLAPAAATAPASRAHPVSTSALCTEGERIHARVAPTREEGAWYVGARFWITRAMPASRWSFGVEFSSTSGNTGGGGAGEGFATADQNGRVDLGTTGAGGLRNLNVFRLDAHERGPETVASPSSSCLLTIQVHY